MYDSFMTTWNVQIASELINGTDYDHRIGFLLESPIDDKSTYTCCGNKKIGCAHYVPLRVGNKMSYLNNFVKKINVGSTLKTWIYWNCFFIENEVAANITYMADSFNETTGLRLLSGLVCSVPDPEYEGVTFKKTPCHSIASCVKRRVAVSSPGPSTYFNFGIFWSETWYNCLIAFLQRAFHIRTELKRALFYLSRSVPSFRRLIK